MNAKFLRAIILIAMACWIIPAQAQVQLDQMNKALNLKMAEERQGLINWVAWTKKACKGVPRLDRAVIEAISRELKVSPSSISLNRVAYAENSAGEPICAGTLYAPSGTYECELEFHMNGSIAKACQIGFDGGNYTNELASRVRLPQAEIRKIEEQIKISTYGTERDEDCEAYNQLRSSGRSVSGSMYNVPERAKGSWRWLKVNDTRWVPRCQ